MTTYLTERIAIVPDICNGRPVIRGMRITVQTVLEFLFAGTSREELLYQYPALENEDIDACFEFALQQNPRFNSPSQGNPLSHGQHFFESIPCSRL